MKYQIICGITVSVLLNGCTTMQMLGESKEEFKKGNYGSGVFQGATAVAFGPIIDIFTFGGALDGQQSTEVWTGVAQQYSNQQAVASATQQAQRAAQLQARQAALARSVQQQSSYGTGSSNGTYGASSSNRSYGTISSGSSSNNYGNSSSTINNGQNNSSNNQPRTERINVPSQTGCVNFAWTKQDGNVQHFKFTNGCAYPVHLTFWETTGSYGGMDLKAGQSQSSWLLRNKSKIGGYKACGLKNGKYDIYYDKATNQCWSYTNFR